MMTVHRDAVTTAARKKATRKRQPRKAEPVTVTRLDPMTAVEVKRIAATIPGSVVRIISANSAIVWNGDYKHPRVRLWKFS